MVGMESSEQSRKTCTMDFLACVILRLNNTGPVSEVYLLSDMLCVSQR